MAYYLGVDGGGSKTRCVVGDEACRLASAEAGPGNITRVGETVARQSLHRAIGEACTAAKIEPAQLERSCIGMAGAGREEIARAIRVIAAEIIPGGFEVVGDMQIAMQAAFGAGPGIVVIAGTGSIAYGRNPRGQIARAGGWGFAISDEGSAHWIGRAAVAAWLRMIDESAEDAALQSSGLWSELRKIWPVESLEQLISLANSRAEFAALLPAVVAAAANHDPVAERALDCAGAELAQLAIMVARRLFSRQDSITIPVAIAGGVFRHASVVGESFRGALGKLDERMILNPEVIDPVEGALQMARLGPAPEISL